MTMATVLLRTLLIIYMTAVRGCSGADTSQECTRPSTESVQLMMQAGANHIPLCTFHDATVMLFTFKVHCKYMEAIHDPNNIDIKLKFRTTTVPSGDHSSQGEKTAPKTETLSCYPIELKRTNDTMMRIKCYMWNRRNDEEMKSTLLIKAIYNNKTVWKYKEPMKPINYLYYCYKKHRVQNVRPFRYYENTRIDVSWKARSYDIVNYNLSHVITVLEDGNKKVQEHVVPQSQCNGPHRSCEYTVKNLNPCAKQMICITTDVIGMDASYQPTPQPTCVTSHDVFRNCTTMSDGTTTGVRLNKTQIIILSVLSSVIAVIVVVIVGIYWRRRYLQKRTLYARTTPSGRFESHKQRHKALITRSPSNFIKSCISGTNDNNNNNNNVQGIDTLTPRIDEPYYEKVCNPKYQGTKDDINQYTIIPFTPDNQTRYQTPNATTTEEKSGDIERNVSQTQPPPPYLHTSERNQTETRMDISYDDRNIKVPVAYSKQLNVEVIFNKSNDTPVI